MPKSKQAVLNFYLKKNLWGKSLHAWLTDNLTGQKRNLTKQSRYSFIKQQRGTKTMSTLAQDRPFVNHQPKNIRRHLDCFDDCCCLVTDLLWKQKLKKKVNLNNIFWSNAHYDIDIDLILSFCFHSLNIYSCPKQWVSQFETVFIRVGVIGMCCVCAVQFVLKFGKEEYKRSLFSLKTWNQCWNLQNV